MATKLWAALVVLFTTLLTSTAQIMYKLGVKNLEFSFYGILTNYYIIGGLFLYIVGGVLIILALKGGDVSVLYPLIATSYIWVSLLSYNFLGEKMNLFKWVGVFGIMLGIGFIGYGSKDAAPEVS